MRKNKKEKNLLDMIPVISPSLDWERDEKGQVTVHIPRKGFFHWIAVKFFKKPALCHISLEKYGNFIWERMDGKRSLYQIAGEVKEAFGEEAEPLYERLVQYIKILVSNGFIFMKDR